jgi:hypothetical protein
LYKEGIVSKNLSPINMKFVLLWVLLLKHGYAYVLYHVTYKNPCEARKAIEARYNQERQIL